MAHFPFRGRDSFLGVVDGQRRDAIEFNTEKKFVIKRWPKEWLRAFWFLLLGWAIVFSRSDNLHSQENVIGYSDVIDTMSKC
jgi:hypothetical protein